MNEWRMRGKDCSPADTLKRIQAIYDHLGLRMKTEHFAPDVKGCFSCRLTIDGNTMNHVGANGKGMSEELCLASANGEMIERLSNRLFAHIQLGENDAKELVLPGCPLYSPRDPAQPECILRLKELIASSVTSPLVLQTPMELTNTLLERVAPQGLDGRFPTLPFYRPGQAEPVYLPIDIILMFSASNGMAAGNSLEEAMVEGLSEILERHAQAVLSDGMITPPVIPNEVVDQYPHIRRVISQIEADPRYEVRVLDCSLGKKLPVVCGVIINRDSGYFGVKFGCQPDMGIALERVFTEALQGINLERASRRNTADFEPLGPGKRTDKWNAMKVGIGKTTARFLMDEPDYPFEPWESTEGKNNREIMQGLLALSRDLGAEVYVHDASYLGFPSVHIYAAGISELIPVDMTQLRLSALVCRVRNAFLHLESVSEEEIQDIALLARIKTGAILENTVSVISGLYYTQPAPGTPYEAEFLEAACEYQLGNTERALALLSMLAERPYPDPKVRVFPAAAALYLSGILSGTQEDEVFAVMEKLFPSEAQHVRDVFGDRTQTLRRLYPSGGGRASQLDESVSCYPAIRRLILLLLKEEREHPTDPAVLVQALGEQVPRKESAV